MTPTDTPAEIEELAQVALSDNTSTGIRAKARLDGRYGFSSPARASAYAKLQRDLKAARASVEALGAALEVAHEWIKEQEGSFCSDGLCTAGDAGTPHACNIEAASKAAEAFKEKYSHDTD